VSRRYRKKLCEESRWVGSPANRQKVDQLDEQSSFTVAGVTDDAREIAQAGQKAIVPYAQQRSAGHIANARRFHHDSSGAAASEALVPVEHIGSDQTLFARAPRNHGGNPGPLRQLDRSDLYRREQP